MSPDCSDGVQIAGLWPKSLVDQIGQGPKGTESEISSTAAGAITASSWNRFHCRYGVPLLNINSRMTDLVSTALYSRDPSSSLLSFLLGLE